MEDVIKNLDTFVDFFYQDFFENTPEIEIIFRNTELTLQKEQLKLGMQKIFSLSENREELDNYLENLGVRHVAYEVGPEHYEFAKKSMLKAFKHVLGNEACDRREDLLVEFVDYVCSKMHEGAKTISKAA